MELAISYLRENPASASLSSRQLAKQVGIASHVLWAKAKKLITE